MNWLANKFEQWIYYETLRMNERGIPVDMPLVHKTIRFIEYYTEMRSRRCREITGGINPTEVKKLTEWLGLPNLQRVALERLLRNKALEPEIEEVIRIRLEQGRVSTKKLYKMVAMDSGDGIMRGSFIYHGAGPGRFTAVGLQPHNFQRPTIKEVDYVIDLLETEQFDRLIAEYPGTRDNPKSVLEAIGSCMRGFIKAPDGMLIVRADYSAIEARVLAWLARQDDMTLSYHEGKDNYVVMAGDIYDEDPEVILAGHKAEILEYSEKRKLGKDTVLGCGYQMWVNTFLMQMEAKGADTIGGIQLRVDEEDVGKPGEEWFNPPAWELAKKAVLTYREKCVKIKNYWSDINEAALTAMRNPYRKYRVRGRIIFEYDGKMLRMWLPSGRPICYPEAHIRNTEKFGKSIEQVFFRAVTERGIRVWESMYGGKWTENGDQGISADLMKHGMYQAAKAGFQNIGTVHDEIITLHPKVYARGRLVRRFEQLICKLPKWAQGAVPEETIPLVAEGKADIRYGK